MSFTLRGSSSALLSHPPCKPSHTHPPRSAANRAALLYLRPCKPSRILPSSLLRRVASLSRSYVAPSSTHALQLRSSAFLLSRPGVWKLATLALRSLRQALRATRSALRELSEEHRASRPGGSCKWRELCSPPEEGKLKSHSEPSIKHNCLNCVAKGGRSRETSSPPFFPPLQAQ